MPAKPRLTATIGFVFITVLIDAIGLGLVIPVLPDVLRRFTTNTSSVSEYYGYFIGAYAAMQFLASPVLGALADRFGRRPILLVSLFGAGIDYLFMSFAPTLPLLFVGRAISGLTGASMTVASSYIADISTEETSAKNFGMIGAAWGMGFIFGPMLGGLLGTFGPVAPFLAAAALNGLNFVFGYFVMPESLPPERRRDVKLARINPLASIVKVLRPSPVVVLVWIYFLLFLAGQIHPVNWTLYTQTKFGWTTREVGLSMSFVGVVMASSQMFLTRVLIPRLGEDRSLTVGTIINGLSFAAFGLATQGWMIFPILLVFAVGGIAMPALQSVLARQVPANEQGELQGSLVSLGSLASILAPLLYTPLFMAGTRPGVNFPGAAYLAAAGVSLFTVLIWQRELSRRSTSGSQSPSPQTLSVDGAGNPTSRESMSSESIQSAGTPTANTH